MTKRQRGVPVYDNCFNNYLGHICVLQKSSTNLKKQILTIKIEWGRTSLFIHFSLLTNRKLNFCYKIKENNT